MATTGTLLDLLRSRSYVDCDTLDVSVAESLGPFVDCTSNQAIAYFELLEHRHKDLLKKSALVAKNLTSKYGDVSLEDLAVEISVYLNSRRIQRSRLLSDLR